MKRVFETLLMLALASPAQAASCEVADILFGPLKLDIIRHDGYETAIVRSATFDNPRKNFGAILGELTVDRGGFAVRNTNSVVVGIITPKLQIEGWDDACDKTSVAEFVRAKRGSYMILNGNKPVGTMEGRFPANNFGVK